MATSKLSLRSAILVNLNIMMGAGIFINTVELAKRAGILGFLAYGIVGLMLVPLIVSIACLVQLYPDGGFFTYAKQELNPLAAFISAWAYFVGKLGSAMLMIHTAMRLCQQIIPVLAPANIFALDMVFLSIFMGLNMFNLKTGRTIQAWLMGFKIIPVLFVILTGLFLIDPANVTPTHVILSGLPSSLPLVLFAFLGFEATCSLSSNIENARKNGPLAIFISYGFVIGLYLLYQFLFYACVGTELATQASYLGAFPALLAKFAHPGLARLIQTTLNLAIAASALGGSYGILYSNSWNLHMLAKNGFIPFSSTFAALNSNFIPYLCVFTEGIICALYLAITFGAQEPLQLTSVMGSIIAYSLSVGALLFAFHRKKEVGVAGWVIYCALINCLLLTGACLFRIYNLGIWPMAGFITLLVAGICLYLISAAEQNKGRQA